MADKLMRTMVVGMFFLILALFSGCGTNGTNLTGADNGKQVTLQAGENLTLTLESNPTTGYSWQVTELDKAILVQEGEPEYKQSPGSEGLVGAGGTETFRFKAAGSGETSLMLGYMRPWESVPPVETFEIRVLVQG
jgi:inhibitor of cysteine peptidase